jgi:hypothetical protein
MGRGYTVLDCFLRRFAAALRVVKNIKSPGKLRPAPHSWLMQCSSPSSLFYDALAYDVVI